MRVGALRRVPRYARFAICQSRVFLLRSLPRRSTTMLMRHTDSGIVKDDQCVDIVHPLDPESSLLMLP